MHGTQLVATMSTSQHGSVWIWLFGVLVIVIMGILGLLFWRDGLNTRDSAEEIAGSIEIIERK